jgi:hypothetical protein
LLLKAAFDGILFQRIGGGIILLAGMFVDEFPRTFAGA